jgi:hypothetical protein
MPRTASNPNQNYKTKQIRSFVFNKSAARKPIPTPAQQTTTRQNATKCNTKQFFRETKGTPPPHRGHPAPQSMPRPKIPSNPMIPNALSDIGFVWSKKEFRHRHAQFRTTKPTATPPAVHLPKPPSYRRSSAFIGGQYAF